MDSDEMVRLLEERGRGLVKRTEALEHKTRWLNDLLTQEREEKRQLVQRLHHLETLQVSDTVEKSKCSLRKRRYHFAVDGHVLDTSLASGIQEMAYFEVKIEPAATHDKHGEEDSEQVRQSYKRFAYSDRPFKAFATHKNSGCEESLKESGSTTKYVDHASVTEWLNCVLPRSNADAVPLLILAKDLLRRLVTKQGMWVETRAGKCEERIEQLEHDLAIAQRIIAKYEEQRPARSSSSRMCL